MAECASAAHRIRSAKSMPRLCCQRDASDIFCAEVKVKHRVEERRHHRQKCAYERSLTLIANRPPRQKCRLSRHW